MADTDFQLWDDTLQHRGRLVLSTARGKVTLLLLVSITFTVAGIAMIGTGGGATIIAILAVVFFGVLGIPVLAWRVVTRRPVTVIDPQGIAIDNVRVGWDEIRSIRVFDAPTRIVLLDTTPDAEARLTTARSLWQRGLARLNTQLTGHTSFALPTDQGVDPDAFAGWLASLHDRYGGGRTTG